jgi:hypothetical protein
MAVLPVSRAVESNAKFPENATGAGRKINIVPKNVD